MPKLRCGTELGHIGTWSGYSRRPRGGRRPRTKSLSIPGSSPPPVFPNETSLLTVSGMCAPPGKGSTRSLHTLHGEAYNGALRWGTFAVHRMQRHSPSHCAIAACACDVGANPAQRTQRQYFPRFRESSFLLVSFPFPCQYGSPEESRSRFDCGGSMWECLLLWGAPVRQCRG